MSALKGKIHHIAKASAGSIDVDRTAAAINGTLVVMSSVIAVVTTATHNANAFTHFTAATGGALGTGGILAAVIANKTIQYANEITTDTQNKLQRFGVGLLATFTLACGIGAGVWAHNHNQSSQNDNAQQASQTAPAPQ